eukprot:TRINITY_DN8394_c0_g2_i1.p1 TRINITY_DN8394_c0_g2~~TRINITY_DN8394_c0_g2_i1.p1  ORF type:complete len:437 (-),score=49.34 TRINITY_DN8394_c0_g2_i1:51-1361(-)
MSTLASKSAADSSKSSAPVSSAAAGASPSSGTVSSVVLPWVEKYRPSSLDDVLAHEDIVTTVRALIEKNRLPHLLFYGPPGTGKTTTALACARMLYKRAFAHQVLELNASDDRGIDVVRRQIKDFASTRQVYNAVPFKMIILDEADMMTGDAQAALRRVIEKFTRNVRFVLICNHVHKLIPAIQSRCSRFRFTPLPRKLVTRRLQFICETERLPVTPKALVAVVRLSNGDMRRAINITQAAAMAAAGASRGIAAVQSPAAAPQNAEGAAAAGPAAPMAVDAESGACGAVGLSRARPVPSAEDTGAGSGADGEGVYGAGLTEELVHETVGYPSPADVHALVEAMMTLSPEGAFALAAEQQRSKGFAVGDLVLEAVRYVARFEGAPDVKIFLLDRLSDIDHNAAMGTNPMVHLAAMVGAFLVAREAIATGTPVSKLVR